jgi:tRNA threonylcarbamoyladenosine biosynthesis protein TsaE
LSRRIETATAAETEAVGAEVAATLVPGDVVLVHGELGAGKTTFVRGACRALGVTGPVTSPTFTIGQRYQGRIPVAHLDLYRVGGLDSEEPGWLADYLGPDTVAFVEWPAPEPEQRVAGTDTIGAFGRIAANIRLTHAGGDRRIIELEA